MTNEEIDKRVAEEVMGWQVHDAIPNDFTLPFFLDGEITRVQAPFQWEPWSPSTDMNAAMEVVKKMTELGLYLSLATNPTRKWDAAFWLDALCLPTGCIDDSPTMAICLAALEAVKR